MQVMPTRGLWFNEHRPPFHPAFPALNAREGGCAP